MSNAKIECFDTSLVPRNESACTTYNCSRAQLWEIWCPCSIITTIWRLPWGVWWKAERTLDAHGTAMYDCSVAFSTGVHLVLQTMFLL